jgi:hypothetical protein
MGEDGLLPKDLVDKAHQIDEFCSHLDKSRLMTLYSLLCVDAAYNIGIGREQLMEAMGKVWDIATHKLRN